MCTYVCASTKKITVIFFAVALTDVYTPAHAEYASKADSEGKSGRFWGVSMQVSLSYKDKNADAFVYQVVYL